MRENPGLTLNFHPTRTDPSNPFFIMKILAKKRLTLKILSSLGQKRSLKGQVFREVCYQGFVKEICAISGLRKPWK